MLVLGGAIVLFFLLKHFGQVRAIKARPHLKEGALVIDVRSVSEYQGGHLAGTVNIPLGELREQIGRHASNKEAPVFLHCLSGTRSAVGQRILRQQGYRRAYNLGSYRRAERILRSAGR